MKIIIHRIPELRRELPRKLIETKRKIGTNRGVIGGNQQRQITTSFLVISGFVDTSIESCASPVGNLIDIEV